MKIGIDGIVLRGKDAGTLRYLEQLLAGLTQFDATNDYTVFVNRDVVSPDIFSRGVNLRCQNIRPSPLVPPALRQQFYFSWHAQGKLDLLHSAAFVPPLRAGCKTIATVPDLVFELFPQTTKWTGRMWWKIFSRRSIRHACRIITHSQATKNDLGRHWRIAEEKIHVVRHYVREIFQPSPDYYGTNAKHGLPDHYVLYVGTLERRKNIPNLIRAFALAKRQVNLQHALVLAGMRGWLYDDIFRTVEELQLRDQVIFLGYVPDEDLPGLYSAAELFVYLSRYEGFGLPVLEAMACGTPVLTSDSSSLPEVVGNAGVMVAPDDVEQAAAEMIRLLSDAELRRDLGNRGLRRASEFSPERFIRDTLSVYEATGK